MKVLSFDPGAKRAGYAVLETGPKYIAAGCIELPRRKDEAYQAYRMRLTNYWVGQTSELLHRYKPGYVVTETVPVYGMNDFSQGYLALVMCTVVHAMALAHGIDTSQISARTVQKNVSIRGKSAKVTKVQVRNGVISLLPELEEVYGKTKIYEPTDALAIALNYLGYST